VQHKDGKKLAINQSGEVVWRCLEGLAALLVKWSPRMSCLVVPCCCISSLEENHPYLTKPSSLLLMFHLHASSDCSRITLCKDRVLHFAINRRLRSQPCSFASCLEAFKRLKTGTVEA